MKHAGREGCCGQCENSGRIRDSRTSRRSLLSWLLGTGVAASLASFFYPVVHFLNPTHTTETVVDEVSGAKVGDLNSGLAVSVLLIGIAILGIWALIRRLEGGWQDANQPARK